MAKDIIITINAKRNSVKLNTDILGVVGENLQGQFIVEFVGSEFVDGVCWLEIQVGEKKGYIELSKVGKTYKGNIKSDITQASGMVVAQVRITQSQIAEQIPIFKSDTFTLNVLESINALEEIPDKYATWIDVANAKIAEINKAIEEVESLTEKTYIKEFTKADFSQVGTEQKFVLAITKNEHNLTNAYVSKMLVNADIPTSCVFEDKTLSTGTVKIYITVDLLSIEEYSGKIYLKGE